MRLAKYRFLLVPLFFVFACVAALAQQNSEIIGTITDPTGAAVAGAKLSLTQNETGFVYHGVSNATGGYVFGGLNVGTYNLQVQAKGFQSYLQTGIVVNVSATVGTDVKLSVGADTQQVTVTADALQVQADSNTVGTLISGDQVTQLATENRNFAALAALGLGVSSALPSNNVPTSIASSFNISVNGLRESHNIWLIDGGEADDRGGGGGSNIMPSMDAIAQFQVMASNYPPDYGISSGATFSMAIKSGTSKYHGELYEFNRNNIFDANNYFSKHNGANIPVPALHENIFGGNLGGPVFIPHVYNADRQKTFFFYNMEGRRIIQGSQPNLEAVIPNADRPVAGQPLQYVAPAYAPKTTIFAPKVADPNYTAKEIAAGQTPGQPFTNNTIPVTLIDPNAVIYYASPLVPTVNTNGDQNTTSVSNPIYVTEEVARVDHKINDKWQLLAHYIHDSVTQGYPDADLGWNRESYNSVSSTLTNPSNSAVIKITGNITPNLLLEASMNYDGNIIGIVNSSVADFPSGWTVAQNKLFNNGSPQFPGVNWNGPTYKSEQLGYGTWHNAAEDYDPKVDISYIHGKHQFKFGFGYNRYTKNQQLQADPEGDYSFSSNQSGDSWMSMALGLASSYSEAEALPTRHWVNQTTSAYVFDNWKVTPRLNLQLGLRYDALPHAWERNNQVSNFEPSQYLNIAPIFNPDGSIAPSSTGVYTVPGFTTPFYLNGMVFPGTNGIPHGVVNNDYNTLQPRVGFSYDLTGVGKTVLRGGFGTFYERMQGNDIYNIANNSPFQFIPNLNNVYFSNPHCSWASASSACLSSTNLPILPVGLTNLATTYKAPAVAQFSLGVQHELAPSVIWIIQYVGNLAWHQNIERNINNFPLTTPNSIRLASAQGNLTNNGNANAYRSYAGYGGINQEEDTTNSNYSGFQSAIRLQDKWGLSGEIDYTYSHMIDITTADLQGVSNPYNLKYDKGGDPTYDRRQILQANYIYKLPIFNKDSGMLHTALGGWIVAGDWIVESGLPFGAALSTGTDVIGLGGGYTNRANVVGKIVYHKTADNWFSNPNTDGGADPLGLPTPGYAGGPNLGFGNGRKDTFLGPDQVNFVTSLYKDFAVKGSAYFEFRAESFNTFNHTEFGNLNTSDVFAPVINSTGIVSANETVGNGNTYGQITSAHAGRVLEFGGKFVF